MTEEFNRIIVYVIAGGIVGLVSKIVFDWLKYRLNNKVKKNPNDCLKTIASGVEWLRDVHDKQDPDGTPLWYVPRQWKKSLDIINERTLESNIHLKNIFVELQQIRKLQEK